MSKNFENMELLKILASYDSEIKTLSAGQTTVVFTNDINNGNFYISGPDVDDSRLTEFEDYTLDIGTKTLTLLESYPADSKVILNFQEFNNDLTNKKDTIVKSESISTLRDEEFYTGAVVYLSEDGRAGEFIWDSSDLSTEVTADTQSGIYVAPSSDLTGASGAWVRQYGGETIDARWCGASQSETAASNHTAIQAALTLTKFSGCSTCLVIGHYEVNDTLTIPSNVALVGVNTFNDDRSTEVFTSKLTMTTTDTNLIEIDQSDIVLGYVWGCALENIALYGAGTGTTGGGVRLENFAYAELKNIFVTGFYYGISVDYGAYSTHNNISGRNNIYCDLFYSGVGTTTSQVFNNCYFRESPYSIVLRNTAAAGQLVTVFNHCMMESSQQGGIIMDKGVAAVFNDPYVENVPDDRITTNGTVFSLGASGTGPVSASYLEVNGGTVNGGNFSLFFGSSIFRVNGIWHSIRARGGQYGRATEAFDGTLGNTLITFEPDVVSNVNVLENSPNIIGSRGRYDDAEQITFTNKEFQNQANLVRRSPLVLSGVGDTITIPITSQVSLHRHQLVKVSGINGFNNTATPRGFYTVFEFGNYDVLSNLTELQSIGNIISVTISGMNIVITTTIALTDPILDIEVLSTEAELIELDSITVS